MSCDHPRVPLLRRRHPGGFNYGTFKDIYKRWYRFDLMKAYIKTHQK